MQYENQPIAASGAFDPSKHDANPSAPEKEGRVSTGVQAEGTPGKFAMTGWEKVGEGLVLIYLGTILAIVSIVAVFILMLAGPALAGIGVFGAMLGGMAILVGQWMCRGVPTESGLRNGITVACVGFSYQWLTGVAMALNPWLHLGRDTLVAMRLTNGAAQLVAVGCFLWFLSGVARRARDASLLTKARWLLNSFLAFTCVWLLLRCITIGSTGHLAHHAHMAHHLRPLGSVLAFAVSLSLLGAMIAWIVSYVSLVKSLADEIDAGR